MPIVRKETLEESDGCDQLNRHVGKAKFGDKASIQYRGWYVDPKSKKLKEFEDMYHSEKKPTFAVGMWNKDPSYEYPRGIFRGIDEAVQQMELGEKVKFEISANETGLVQEHRGFVGTVPPYCDLVVDITLKSVSRNGVVHNRKQPKDTSSGILKILYCCFRAY